MTSSHPSPNRTFSPSHRFIVYALIVLVMGLAMHLVARRELKVPVESPYLVAFIENGRMDEAPLVTDMRYVKELATFQFPGRQPQGAGWFAIKASEVITANQLVKFTIEGDSVSSASEGLHQIMSFLRAKFQPRLDDFKAEAKSELVSLGRNVARGSGDAKAWVEVSKSLVSPGLRNLEMVASKEFQASPRAQAPQRGIGFISGALLGLAICLLLEFVRKNYSVSFSMKA